MQANIPATIQRVIQVTVAAKITAAVTFLVPSLSNRIAVSVGAAVLAAGACRVLPARLPSATLVADLALAVATSVLLQAVLAPGAASLPLSIAHCCMVLEVGQALPLGHLADSFLANTQFIFAQAVGQLLFVQLTPSMAFIGACALAGSAHWWAARDTMLSTALTQAAIFVLRTILVRSIPPTLQLPTVAALLCFSRPLYEFLGFAEPLYTFVLYQAAETLKAALASLCSPLVTTIAALTLLCVSPAPVFASAAQMAAVSAGTDLTMHAVASAADTDPLLCLLPILVFASILTAAAQTPKKIDANPPGPSSLARTPQSSHVP